MSQSQVDTVMTDASSTSSEQQPSTVSPLQEQINMITGDLINIITSINKNSTSIDKQWRQYMTRSAKLRKSLHPRSTTLQLPTKLILQSLIPQQQSSYLHSFISTLPEVSSTEQVPTTPLSLTPSSELFLSALVLVVLYDHHLYSQAVTLYQDILHRYYFTSPQQVPTSSYIISQVYHYGFMSHERISSNMDITTSNLLSLLMHGLSQSSQQQSTTTISPVSDVYMTCLVYLLRYHMMYSRDIMHGMYALVQKMPINPQSSPSVSPSLMSRYYYYLAYMYACMGGSNGDNYTLALDSIKSAINRISNTTTSAFHQQCMKLQIIIHLLMGNYHAITDSSSDNIPAAYHDLCRCMITGDVQMFDTMIMMNQQYLQVYTQDRVLHMIKYRIRYMVLRCALQRLVRSYSRISLQDITTRTNTQSTDIDPLDMECIIAKCIRDGVLSPSSSEDDTSQQIHLIRGNNGSPYLQVDHASSSTSTSTLSTSASSASQEYHKRITYTTQLRQQCITGMKYPQQLSKTSRGALQGLGDEEIEDQRQIIDEDDMDNLGDDDMDEDSMDNY